MPVASSVASRDTTANLGADDRELLRELASEWLGSAAEMIVQAEGDPNPRASASRIREGARMALAASHVLEAADDGVLDVSAPGVEGWLRCERDTVLAALHQDYLTLTALESGTYPRHVLGMSREDSLAVVRRIIDEDLDHLALLNRLLEHPAP